MSGTSIRRLGPALALLLVVGCGGSGRGDREVQAKVPLGRFEARRAFGDLRAQVALGPRPAGSPGARREVALIERRLRRAGVSRIVVQAPFRNVVARIPGTQSGVVVAGAHYDTKDIRGFVGANDGASGVALLLELARDLPSHLRGPSLELVFFDAEESPRGQSFERGGDRGSGQYVRYAQNGGAQGSPPLGRLRAMVLFDMVADCDLRVPREANSAPALYERFAEAARRARATGSSAPFTGQSPGVLDDHAPFVQAGVPAVDLIDFDYGPGPPPGAWWHTRQDNLSHVCARSLGAVGRPALTALPAIGAK
jgi:hypothetical protein